VGVVHVAEAEVRFAQLGFLFPDQENVHFSGRSENPAVAEIKANRHTERRVQVVGITPVTRCVGRSVAPRIVVEIAIAKTEIGRNADAAPGKKGKTAGAAGAEDQAGSGTLVAGAGESEARVGPRASGLETAGVQC